MGFHHSSKSYNLNSIEVNVLNYNAILNMKNVPVELSKSGTHRVVLGFILKHHAKAL